MEQLHKYLTDNISCAMNFVRTALSSMSVKNLKETHPLLLQSISSNTVQFRQWYQAGIDIVESRTVKENRLNERRNDLRTFAPYFLTTRLWSLLTSLIS